MKKNCKYLIALVLIFSCNSKKDKLEIEIRDQYVDTSFGMAQYLVYASDTNWAKMYEFSDSLSKLYSGKTFDVVEFSYPKHSVFKFKKNVPFAIQSTNSYPNFVIAAYYDTSHVYPPVLVKYPEYYKQAKDYEKSHPYKNE